MLTSKYDRLKTKNNQLRDNIKQKDQDYQKIKEKNNKINMNYKNLKK